MIKGAPVAAATKKAEIAKLAGLNKSLRDLPVDALTEYEGIPCTTVAQALVDCQGLVMADRLAEATQRARAEGLLREMRLLGAEGAA